MDTRVELQREMAPKTVRYVKSSVNRGLFDGCGIYRAEPPGLTIDAGSSDSRTGNALLQGGLYSCGRQEDKDLPLETKLGNRKGIVALITVMEEPSWGALERLMSLPTRQEVHPSGTVMRILMKPVILKVSMEKQLSPLSAELHS